MTQSDRLAVSRQVPRPSLANMVPVRVGDLLSILESASKQGYCWVEDFGDETMIVPRDLVEVVTHFAAERRRSA